MELKLRKKLEFDALEQGRAGHVEFYVKFKKLLFELKDAKCLNLDEEDLYLAYITKLSPQLRGEIIRRKVLFAGEGHHDHDHDHGDGHDHGHTH